MTIWYFDEPGKVVSRPVAITSSPSSGWTPGRAREPFQITASSTAPVVLEVEIDVAGGVARDTRPISPRTRTRPNSSSIDALHRAGELGDGELRGVAAPGAASSNESMGASLAARCTVARTIERRRRRGAKRGRAGA